jgi:hypothetical protein
MSPLRPFLGAACAAAVVVACSATDGPSNGAGASGSGASGQGGDGIDLGGNGGGITGSGGAAASCKVTETADDAVPECTETAPPNAFSPAVQWTWTAPAPLPTSMASGSITTPLVANFTDDNGDGAVDLCDVPDVVVTAIEDMQFTGSGSGTGLSFSGTMHLLSGDTGQEKLTFAGKVDPNVNVALGDIDDDGLPEVVAADPSGHLVAFENDGELKWTGDLGSWFSVRNSYCTAIALYDLDGDGSVEILAAFEVFDSNGHLLWSLPGNGTEFLDGEYWCPTPTAADLDGDGKLEVLFGHATYRHDGTPLWTLPGKPGQPHVGNFDADADPEVVVTTADGISLVEANGTVVFGPVRPTGGTASANCWGKPGVIHDFDGDGHANLATGSCTDYSMYQLGATATPLWTASVQDLSGLATGTAFDFLGDGVADAIYADEQLVYVYDGQSGALEMSSPRTSGTLIEYPVVADIDNDGSAEIVFVSNYFSGGSGPTVTVLRDQEDRWIQARRIWNQHAYHVTNVREDAVIPKQMKKSWQLLNTYRTNSQIEGGGDCDPPTPK